MILGIMQPYFLPYIGYFQLIKAVDKFVVYDNIKYTKKGWINRNRILINDEIGYITLPLKNASDYLNIIDRELHEWHEDEKRVMTNRVVNNYCKAPYFDEVIPLIKEIFNFENTNLFWFLYNSILKMNNYLGIETPVIISSTIDIDHELRCVDKVLAICEETETETYINPIGGVSLYNKEDFRQRNIELKFIQTNEIFYKQFGGIFQPSLSIIDVLMFNGRERTKELLNEYELL